MNRTAELAELIDTLSEFLKYLLSLNTFQNQEIIIPLSILQKHLTLFTINTL